MICSGSYDYHDRICSLCIETNQDAFQKCVKYAKERKETKETNVILKFFARHCKYATEYYAEGEDHIGCTLEDCSDGCYPNCIPFDDYCILKKAGGN